MDTRGIGRPDVQALCSRLAETFLFAARLDAMARQAAADRAGKAIARFDAQCRSGKPGRKGYPCLQRDIRSIAYQTAGRRLEADGRRITCTDGHGSGTLRRIGTGCIETFRVRHIKRVRLLTRADGYSVQFAVQADRELPHEPTGARLGIDLGELLLHRLGRLRTVPHRRFLRASETKLKHLHRRVSTKQRRSKHRK